MGATFEKDAFSFKFFKAKKRKFSSFFFVFVLF